MDAIKREVKVEKRGVARFAELLFTASVVILTHFKQNLK